MKRLTTCCAAAVLAWLHLAQPAAAEVINCKPITQVPAVISSPGLYCLEGSFKTTQAKASDSAITIASDNVTVDCNGFELDGRGAGLATLASGITAFSRSQVTVRNCRITGYNTGIILINGNLNRVEDNVLALNTDTGVAVHGSRSLVRRNEILETGGAYGDGIGISLTNRVDVIDNRVSGVKSGAAGSAFGMLVSYGEGHGGAIVRGNLINGLQASTGRTRYGVFVLGDARMHFAANTIVFSPEATASDRGIRCGQWTNAVHGNYFIGFLHTSTAWAGCSAHGNVLSD